MGHAVVVAPAIRLVKLNTSMKTPGLDFYDPLRRRKLTHSLRHYSVTWLGAAPNYACVAATRGPSAAALLHLFRALWDRRHFGLAAQVGRALLWHLPLTGRSA